MALNYILLKIFKKAERSTSRKLSKKCRVCLQPATIPIFGGDGKPNISRAIRVFSGVDIEKDDELPQLICDGCHSLLKGAILFRKTAKQSNEILMSYEIKPRSKKRIKQEFTELIPQKKAVKKAPSLLEKFFSSVTSDGEEPANPQQYVSPKSLKKKNRVKCRVCSKIVSKSYHKEHLAVHDPTISQYICDVCGKTFRQRCAYINHNLIHKNVFPFQCAKCPYRGRSSGLLKVHMKSHSGDYKYMCSECPAKFLTKSNLNKHSWTHKDAPYQCDTCKKGFISKVYLERHFEVDHLGMKNHVCNMCGKTFGYRKHMMRHQLDVHKREKKYNGRTPAYLEAEYKKQMEVD